MRVTRATCTAPGGARNENGSAKRCNCCFCQHCAQAVSRCYLATFSGVELNPCNNMSGGGSFQMDNAELTGSFLLEGSCPGCAWSYQETPTVTATPGRRWVAANCGTSLGSADFSNFIITLNRLGPSGANALRITVGVNAPTGISGRIFSYGEKLVDPPSEPASPCIGSSYPNDFTAYTNQRVGRNGSVSLAAVSCEEDI